jgi:hypothetical protein
MTCGVTLLPCQRIEVQKIAAQQQLSLSKLNAKLLLRGLAAYKQDSLLDEPEMVVEKKAAGMK